MSLARAFPLLVCAFGLALPALAQDDPGGRRRGQRARPATVATLDDVTNDLQPGLADDWVKAFRWRSIGPASMGGRIIALAVNEQDPSMFWVATASGGLLKTTNNGITFEHQFDHESTVSIGDVCVAPSDPNIVWVGTGEYSPRNSVSYGDGVYKSTDGGKTWKNMGLKETFQTGRIAIHPKNPDVVYVGSLGRLYGPNEHRGLYKTTDGGENWERILYVDDKTGVIDVQMHPKKPDTLLVATYERQRDGFDGNDPAVKIAPGSGLYRTTDGGKTFKKLTKGLPTVNLGRIGIDYYRKNPKVVYLVLESELIAKPGQKVGWTGFDAEDAETGAKLVTVTKDSPAAKAGLKVDDIVLAVDGNTVLSNFKMLEHLTQKEIGAKVALEIARQGESHSVELELGKRPEPQAQQGRQGGARTARGGPGGGRGGRGRGGRGRVSFTGSLGGQRQNLQKLQGKEGWQHGGIYRSEDGGTTWKRVNTLNPRPMYFSRVLVDPNDDNHVYVLGVSAYRSKDGGKTFTADAGRGVHSDHHALWIDPSDGRHMILGGDGGIYVSYDRCDNWDHLNHVAIGQFYHVAVGPRRDYWVYGGLQDNGSWGAPHRSKRGSGTVNEDWLRIGGGDGFICLVDTLDPDRIYYESQNGSTGRTHLLTMESGRMRARPPEGERYRFNWKTPFILSNHNSRIYYNAGNFVFRSVDRGENLATFSPEITRTDRGAASALAESPMNPEVMYVGSTDGALWGTRDGKHGWKDLWVLEADIGEEEAAGIGSNGGPRLAAPATRDGSALRDLVPGPRWVSSITASRYEEGRAYVTLDGHRSDDDDPYVLVTEDHGESWQSLRANLPRGSTRVIREDLVNPDILYLGTEFAVWVSVDRGKTWTKLNSNLPTVAVHELAQHPTCGDMVAGTHGRSLWILDVTPLRQMTKEARDADAHLYKPNTVVLWQTLHRRAGTNRRFTGENPPSGAQIFYSLKKDARAAKLEIKDPGGKLLRELQADPKAGLHSVQWDLRAQRDPSASPQQRFRGFGGRGGGRVQPGTYHVVLTVDGETFEQKLEVERE